MEFKGTRGEWFFDEPKAKVGKYAGYELDIHSIDNDSIITCWCNSDNPTEEELANAQLISSAPELLKALQSMTFIFESLADKLPSRVEDFNCYQEAKAAINKALGL